MINFKTATVIRVIADDDGVMELEVKIDGEVAKAINYSDSSGAAVPGDQVIVNTTAVDLSLGSGGRHFVLWNLSRREFSSPGNGHLMKLRYTPMQRAGLSVEEEAGPDHERLKDAVDVGGMPVVACGLHSQVLPAVATIKHQLPEAKVVFVMTDGGALPAKFSKTAVWLRREEYIEALITVGQAYGGDLEAVNLYSGLAAARAVVGADIAVVAMGPGIAGTGTALGHTGMEQGQIINAAASLGGKPVAVVRLGRGDARQRHIGLSHHSINALMLASLAPALVALPSLDGDLSTFGRLVAEQIESSGIGNRHQVKVIENEVTLQVLAEIASGGGPKASTMGRAASEEPAFFLAAGAAGIAAVGLARQEVIDV